MGTGIFGGNADNGANAGCRLWSGGAIAAARTSGSSATFSSYTVGNSTPQISLYANGSATFQGDIDANNVSFNAGTADEINVRERLIKAKETFQELRIAIESAANFSELKTAMLVALEDYNAY